MRNGTISKATIGRLPLYLQFIRTVRTEMVSSATVARHLGLGEVQVRKDLASVCPAGMPKIGYPTERLLNDLEAVLGMKQTVPAVVVGAGKLGRALMAYDGFREYGLEIAAAGLEEACRKSEVIRSGVNTYAGKLTNKNVAAAHNYDFTELQELI